MHNHNLDHDDLNHQENPQYHHQEEDAIDAIQEEDAIYENEEDDPVDENEEEDEIDEDEDEGEDAIEDDHNDEMKSVSDAASASAKPNAPEEAGAPRRNSNQHQNIVFDSGSIMCQVCGDRASGFHYGVHSCEGCKGFFRRSIQQKIQYRPCSKNESCPIMRINRNRCQFCRLKKCVSVGMSRDAIRFGRVPKREKAKILAAMQINRNQLTNQSAAAAATSAPTSQQQQQENVNKLIAPANHHDNNNSNCNNSYINHENQADEAGEEENLTNKSIRNNNNGRGGAPTGDQNVNQLQLSDTELELLCSSVVMATDKNSNLRDAELVGKVSEKLQSHLRRTIDKSNNRATIEISTPTTDNNNIQQQQQGDQQQHLSSRINHNNHKNEEDQILNQQQQQQHQREDTYQAKLERLRILDEVMNKVPELQSDQVLALLYQQHQIELQQAASAAAAAAAQNGTNQANAAVAAAALFLEPNSYAQMMQQQQHHVTNNKNDMIDHQQKSNDNCNRLVTTNTIDTILRRHQIEQAAATGAFAATTGRSYSSCSNSASASSSASSSSISNGLINDMLHHQQHQKNRTPDQCLMDDQHANSMSAASATLLIEQQLMQQAAAVHQQQQQQQHHQHLTSQPIKLHQLNNNGTTNISHAFAPTTNGLPVSTSAPEGSINGSTSSLENHLAGRLRLLESPSMDSGMDSELSSDKDSMSNKQLLNQQHALHQHYSSLINASNASCGVGGSSSSSRPTTYQHQPYNPVGIQSHSTLGFASAHQHAHQHSTKPPGSGARSVTPGADQGLTCARMSPIQQHVRTSQQLNNNSISSATQQQNQSLADHLLLTKQRYQQQLQFLQHEHQQPNNNKNLIMNSLTQQPISLLTSTPEAEAVARINRLKVSARPVSAMSHLGGCGISLKHQPTTSEETTKSSGNTAQKLSSSSSTSSTSSSSMSSSSIDDMPMLKRALQAPPLINANMLMDEAYRHHKKFRAARGGRGSSFSEMTKPTTTSSSSSDKTGAKNKQQQQEVISIGGNGDKTGLDSVSSSVIKRANNNNDKSPLRELAFISSLERRRNLPARSQSSIGNHPISSSASSGRLSALAHRHSTLLDRLNQPSNIQLSEHQLRCQDIMINEIIHSGINDHDDNDQDDIIRSQPLSPQPNHSDHEDADEDDEEVRKLAEISQHETNDDDEDDELLLTVEDDDDHHDDIDREDSDQPRPYSMTMMNDDDDDESTRTQAEIVMDIDKPETNGVAELSKTNNKQKLVGESPIPSGALAPGPSPVVGNAKLVHLENGTGNDSERMQSKQQLLSNRLMVVVAEQQQQQQQQQQQNEVATSANVAAAAAAAAATRLNCLNGLNHKLVDEDYIAKRLLNSSNFSQQIQHHQQINNQTNNKQDNRAQVKHHSPSSNRLRHIKSNKVAHSKTAGRHHTQTKRPITGPMSKTNKLTNSQQTNTTTTTTTSATNQSKQSNRPSSSCCASSSSPSPSSSLSTLSPSPNASPTSSPDLIATINQNGDKNNHQHQRHMMINGQSGVLTHPFAGIAGSGHHLSSTPAPNGPSNDLSGSMLRGRSSSMNYNPFGTNKTQQQLYPSLLNQHLTSSGCLQQQQQFQPISSYQYIDQHLSLHNNSENQNQNKIGFKESTTTSPTTTTTGPSAMVSHQPTLQVNGCDNFTNQYYHYLGARRSPVSPASPGDTQPFGLNFYQQHHRQQQQQLKNGDGSQPTCFSSAASSPSPTSPRLITSLSYHMANQMNTSISKLSLHCNATAQQQQQNTSTITPSYHQTIYDAATTQSKLNTIQAVASETASTDAFGLLADVAAAVSSQHQNHFNQNHSQQRSVIEEPEMVAPIDLSKK